MFKYIEGAVSALKLLQLKFTVVWVTAVLALNSLLTKSRMSHENGIVTRGRLRIVDEPTFPRNEFFTPGTEFPCRMRFGAATWKDDAKMVIRGAGLKLADQRHTSPLDLLLNSGSLAIFWSARTFVGFMRGTIAGRGKNWTPYLGQQPMALAGGQDGMRRDPTSIGSIVYHSQTCFGLVDLDANDYYVRYRLWPLSYEPDGTPTPDDLTHPWFQNPLPDEIRNRNYLKDEARERLAGGTIEFMLQLQARRRPPGADPEWVTAQYVWDDTVHPWHDVAHVVLDEALDYTESMLTGFDLAHHPDCLPLPRGRSIDDPHSLMDLRLAALWTMRARLLSYRLRGMPAEFGDSRHDPDWIAVPPMPDPP